MSMSMSPVLALTLPLTTLLCEEKRKEKQQKHRVVQNSEPVLWLIVVLARTRLSTWTLHHICTWFGNKAFVIASHIGCTICCMPSAFASNQFQFVSNLWGHIAKNIDLLSLCTSQQRQASHELCLGFISELQSASSEGVVFSLYSERASFCNVFHNVLLNKLLKCGTDGADHRATWKLGRLLPLGPMLILRSGQRWDLNSHPSNQ